MILNKVRFYRVGGYVRDGLLNLKHNDIDYCVEAKSYDDMIDAIKLRGEDIVYMNPELQTAKTKQNNHQIDYVLCRKESDYIDNHKPSKVTIGTLYDDLSRRDFTINSIAIDEDNNYIDYFGGLNDINNRVIKCVGNTKEKLIEDPIRILRAFRFLIKLPDFNLDIKIIDFINNPELINIIKLISKDLIRNELELWFKYDTIKTMVMLNKYPLLLEAIFKIQGLWLLPTFKQIKF